MYQLFSAGLNAYLAELDRRVDDAQKDTKKHVPKRKERVESTPLEIYPPPTIPKWAVDKDWLKGT